MIKFLPVRLFIEKAPAVSPYGLDTISSALEQALDDVPALDRADAQMLADRIFDGVVAELRRAPSLPASAADWDLFFAEARIRAAEQIYRRIHDHVDRTDLLRVLEQQI